MARTQRATTRVVYQIKVTLKGSKPPIWRRMQITSETTLVQLHRILQRVMGWGRARTCISLSLVASRMVIRAC